MISVSWRSYKEAEPTNADSKNLRKQYNSSCLLPIKHQSLNFRLPVLNFASGLNYVRPWQQHLHRLNPAAAASKHRPQMLSPQLLWRPTRFHAAAVSSSGAVRVWINRRRKVDGIETTHLLKSQRRNDSNQSKQAVTLAVRRRRRIIQMGMAASAKTTAAGRRGGGVGVAKKCHEETTNRFQKNTTNNQKIRFANITYAFLIFKYLCRYLISICIKCCEVLLAWAHGGLSSAETLKGSWFQFQLIGVGCETFKHKVLGWWSNCWDIRRLNTNHTPSDLGHDVAQKDSYLSQMSKLHSKT